MNIAVIGTGYVGLVSGTCLAAKGHHVICVDVDGAKVDKINRGEPPIHEAGLDTLLKENIGKRLHATTDLRHAVLRSSVSLIAVGTPFDGSGIDLSHVRQAAAQLGAVLRDTDDRHTVVVKSTVVPGTTDGMVVTALEEASGKRAGADFGVGMNPEFLREGEAVHDFMNPDRIVIGGIDERTFDVLGQLYDVFPEVDKVLTSTRTAEMIKYAANSLLATLISFSNEIGNLCAALGGVDSIDVMKGVHLDKRFSPLLPDGQRIVPGFTSYLEAGCGFGGSCFPKDVKALMAHGRKAGVPMRMLDAVMEVNDQQPQQVILLLKKYFPVLTDVRTAVLGMAFKPGTDDVRESPSLAVIRTLQDEGARVRAFDPVARHEAQQQLGDRNIEYCDSLSQTVDGADAILVLTRWEEFQSLPDLIMAANPQPVVIDGRRMLNRALIARYEGIGLSTGSV